MPTAIVIYNIKASFISCDYLYNLLSKTNLLNRTFFKTSIGRYTITQKHTGSLEEVLQLRSKHYF